MRAESSAPRYRLTLVPSDPSASEDLDDIILGVITLESVLSPLWCLFGACVVANILTPLKVVELISRSAFADHETHCCTIRHPANS